MRAQIKGLFVLEKINLLKQEIKKVVVGQEEMINACLTGIFCNGHILLEGVPGVAKTTTVNTLAKGLGLDFKRIQFTPDLLPGDIIGAEIFDQKNNEFKIKKGPIFTNLLLADEINRAPAKVQSALLEVMQERQVTISQSSFTLPPPFFVLATQNPIEQEGVYSLPEAQLDRFMLKVFVSYPSKEQELEIVAKARNSQSGAGGSAVQKILEREDLSEISRLIESVHMDEQVQEYIVDLIFATRASQHLAYGASPRASIDLTKAARSFAFLSGKDYVSPSDVAQAAYPVLRHRLVLSYEAQANETPADAIIDEILASVRIP